MNLTTHRRPVIAQRATGSRLKNFVILVKTGIQLLCGSLLCSFMLTACSSSNQAPPNLNMVISVSSDGNYAIATNTNKQAVLWNLKDHSYKIVFKNANIYSAYFIKNTNDFIYQNDKTNEVVVENVNGQTIKTFNPGFPVYSEIMTGDLKTYVATDVNYNTFWFRNGQKKQLLYYFCSTNFGDKVPPKGAYYTCGGIEGLDKNLTLSVSSDEKTLVGAGSSEIFIWNLQNGNQLAHLVKNDAQTVAAISPDGNHVITGDTSLGSYSYNLSTNSGYPAFITLPSKPEIANYLYGAKGIQSELLSLKFIDKTHFLVFFYPELIQSFHYIALYSDSPTINDAYWTKKIFSPIKYLSLEVDPNSDSSTWPLVSDDFSRDQAIDTSPSAHILVMSQQNANGIIVYKYDPTTQTLKREWVGTVKSSWWSF